MKTHEVNAALRKAYPNTEYAIMFEVGNTTGSNVRRHADAIVMNLWPSRGLIIEGFEVKVSRSDWTRELKDPEKAELISRYCDKWWVVAPAGIVHEHEVPALWGYKQVTDGGRIVTVKDAPRKTKEELTALDRGFVAAMLRRASDADAAVVDALVNKQLAAERERMEKEIQRRVDAQTRMFNSAGDKVKQLKELGVDLNGWDSPETLARYYKIGKKVAGASLSTMSHSAIHLETMAKTLRELASNFSAEDVKEN
jgi:hypothetical protein